ncbi:MAG: RluA family pseudouridine synthase [Pseudomonadota bacterium]
MTTVFKISEPGDARVISVLAETESYLVLDKPAGLLSVPGKTEPDCLEARVRAHFPDALTVHRLDMATSGICVMARGKVNLADLQQQFERRQTSKVYQAIVAGRITDDFGTVNAPMRCDWPNRPLQMIDHVQGRHALTHWSVLERMESTTRVRLAPVTGRSHQLRVHMMSIGHAIVGDDWYADKDIAGASERLLLHAHTLAFKDPQTGEKRSFSASCPF